VLFAKKLKRAHQPGKPRTAVYELEFHDSEAEEALFPSSVTWRTFFKDVHGLEAESASGLLNALKMAGWSDEQIARYRGIDLDGVIPDDAPERKEYDEHRLTLCESEEVFIGPLECAYALMDEVTRNFRTAPEDADNILGTVRLYPCKDLTHLRRVEAVGALTLTAIQELLNRHQAGIRVELANPTIPPDRASA
jgi:hypothetical protein